MENELILGIAFLLIGVALPFFFKTLRHAKVLLFIGIVFVVWFCRNQYIATYSSQTLLSKDSSTSPVKPLKQVPPPTPTEDIAIALRNTLAYQQRKDSADKEFYYASNRARLTIALYDTAELGANLTKVYWKVENSGTEAFDMRPYVRVRIDSIPANEYAELVNRGKTYSGVIIKAKGEHRQTAVFENIFTEEQVSSILAGKRGLELLIVVFYDAIHYKKRITVLDLNYSYRRNDFIVNTSRSYANQATKPQARPQAATGEAVESRSDFRPASETRR